MASVLGGRSRRDVQRADHREGREVDQLGLQPGLARHREQVLHGVAAGADDDDAHLAALAVVDALQHAVVEHRLLERHRKLLLRLEAHRGLELLLVVDDRQLEHAQRDLLAGDAEADALRQVVLAEEGPDPVGEAVDVDDLALVEEAGAEGLGRRAHERRRASAGELGGRQEAGLDVEPNNRSCL